jgi:hypothetical protein
MGLPSDTVLMSSVHFADYCRIFFLLRVSQTHSSGLLEAGAAKLVVVFGGLVVILLRDLVKSGLHPLILGS